MGKWQIVQLERQFYLLRFSSCAYQIYVANPPLVRAKTIAGSNHRQRRYHINAARSGMGAVWREPVSGAANAITVSRFGGCMNRFVFGGRLEMRYRGDQRLRIGLLRIGQKIVGVAGFDDTSSVHDDHSVA